MNDHTEKRILSATTLDAVIAWLTDALADKAIVRKWASTEGEDIGIDVYYEEGTFPGGSMVVSFDEGKNGKVGKTFFFGDHILIMRDKDGQCINFGLATFDERS